MQQYSLTTTTAELDLLLQRLQQLQIVELVRHGEAVGILLSTLAYQQLQPPSSPAKALHAFRATADQEALQDLDTAMFSQERHLDRGRVKTKFSLEIHKQARGIPFRFQI